MKLEELTWPELEASLAAGRRTVTIGLGSTEQHGPHLPFATDTWIAEALAERFCARIERAVQGPTLALGCSSEHMAFPGTVSLGEETLERVLADVVASLARHGFAEAFVFTAHGGNYAALRAALPALERAAAPMRLVAFLDFDRLTARLSEVSAADGISFADSGLHAGELETSILQALRPESVRTDRLAAGLPAPAGDSSDLFYPSLRNFAENGVVGDPRGANPERAERYLGAWVELLVEAYREERRTGPRLPLEK